jgi:hypothetical protein
MQLEGCIGHARQFCCFGLGLLVLLFARINTSRERVWNMKISRYKLLAVCFAACVSFQSPAAFSQESNAKGAKMMSNVHPMAKDAMDMKKAKEMAAPPMLMKAKEQMMASDAMPKAMAMEATMAKSMKDEKNMKMVQEQAMAPMPDGKPMVSDEQIKAAIRKIFNDPVQFQAMLQALIMRETASNMMMAADSKPAEAMMMADDMKMARKEMMADESTTMKMAKEMMMHAMMMDKDISMAVKEASMKPSDPAMDKMMKSESMMMEKDKMMKEPSMKKEMAKEAMMREMAKPPAMMSDKKK